MWIKVSIHCCDKGWYVFFFFAKELFAVLTSFAEKLNELWGVCVLHLAWGGNPSNVCGTSPPPLSFFFFFLLATVALCAEWHHVCPLISWMSCVKFVEIPWRQALEKMHGTCHSLNPHGGLVKWEVVMWPDFFFWGRGEYSRCLCLFPQLYSTDTFTEGAKDKLLHYSGLLGIALIPELQIILSFTMLHT